VLYHRFHDQIRYPRSKRGAYTSVEEDNRSGRANTSRRLERIRYSRRAGGRNHRPPALISIISKSRLPCAIQPPIRNVGWLRAVGLRCGGSQDLVSPEIATSKNAKTTNADRCASSLMQLPGSVPPYGRSSPDSERTVLTDGGEGREKKTIGK